MMVVRRVPERGLEWFVRALCLGWLLYGSVALAAPEIHHTPPKFEDGEDLTIKVKITAAGGVIEPTLYFRKGSSGDYKRLALTTKAKGNYEARLPSALLTGGETLEYYIGAFAAKDLSEGFWKSKDSPFKLSLKPPEQHLIHITTSPAGAILDIDRVTVGPSPYDAPLKAGTHHVTARLAGYKALEEFEFTMPRNKDLTLPFSMTKEGGAVESPAPPPATTVAPPPAPAPPPVAPVPVAEAPKPIAPPPDGMARVRIVTVPAGAKIAVDGKDSGLTPVELVLSPGAYIVSAKLNDYRPTDQIVKLSAGDAVVRVITLRAALQAKQD